MYPGLRQRGEGISFCVFSFLGALEECPLWNPFLTAGWGAQ